jgi:hypothetical protein
MTDFSGLRRPSTTWITSDALVGTAASITSPVEPSIETGSPSLMTLPATFIVLA